MAINLPDAVKEKIAQKLAEQQQKQQEQPQQPEQPTESGQ